jgi:1-acyl-sn-glycerol-3-phosphate acyltransferase
MGDMQPFKDGAAYVAIKAGAPVVPIGLIGNRERLPVGATWVTPGTVRVIISDPVPTIDLTLRERTKLTQVLWVRIATLIGWPIPQEQQEMVTAGAPS